MANVHIYILIEALSISASNRNTLFALMRGILGQSTSQPAFINHDCERLDGNAIIIEALFNEDDISISQMKQYLATTFGVDAGDIGNVNDSQNTYGLESIFSYPDGVTNRIRYIAFGYDGGYPTWAESRAQAKAYKGANAVAWDAPN